MHFRLKILPALLAATLLSGCMDAANDLDDPNNPEIPETPENPDGSDDPEGVPGTGSGEMVVTAPDDFYVVNSLSDSDGQNLINEFQNQNLDYSDQSDLDGYYLHSGDLGVSYNPSDSSALLVAQAYYPSRSIVFKGLIGFSNPDSSSVATDIPAEYAINATSNAIADRYAFVNNGFDTTSPDEGITAGIQNFSRSTLMYRIGVSQLVLEGLTYDQAEASPNISEAVDRAFVEDPSNYKTYENYLYHYLHGITFENGSGTRSLEFNFNEVTYSDSATGETTPGTYRLTEDSQLALEISLGDMGSWTTQISSGGDGTSINLVNEDFFPDRTID